MSIEIGFWRLGAKVQRVNFTAMPNEEKLESILAADISIIDPNLLLIGRQVPTKFNKYIDLLAMDADGNLVVIELKRAKTPREVVAQVLDYGSWVRTLGDETIAAIFNAFSQKYYPDRAARSLDDAFKERFGVKELPEALNETHELLVVAGELDPSTERIVSYLSDEYGVAINVVFFRFFKDGDAEYLTRVWLIDPGEVETKTIEKRAELAWNGEFYVSFGEQPTRRWQDARTHGYIAAGGGAWYTNTLQMLEPGNRIWVNVPGRGYVGVGEVTEAAVPITDFQLRDKDGDCKAITEVVSNMPSTDLPEDMLEYFVRVNWIATVPLTEAIKEKGFFGNQNTVARPKSRNWVHTVERLKSRFSIPETSLM